MSRIIYFIYWVILPFLNFLLWFYVSKTQLIDQGKLCAEQATQQTDSLKQMLQASLLELQAETIAQPCGAVDANSGFSEAMCQHKAVNIEGKVDFKLVSNEQFDTYRTERLASMTLDLVLQTYTSQDTIIMHYRGADGSSQDCLHLDHHFLDISESTCLAISFLENTVRTYDVGRFDSDIDLYGLSIANPDPSQIDKYSSKYAPNLHNKGKYWPTGFFRKVPKDKGRIRTKEKLGMFLQYFEEMEKDLRGKLDTHNIKAGDDVVVMVLNEGELDLYLNFACSCSFHNISLHNVLVFAGSASILPLIEATGAMALYHTGYASVSKKASTDYLDRVFVDMMWYKAFSVYFVLKQGVNILFQDVDLVWFKDPMQYFHDYVQKTKPEAEETGAYVEAFFSDDGQRSKRYTPYFANSGFYYLLSTSKSIYFTWSIMIAMDAIQVLGSHQNVLTTRLIEGLALNFQHLKLLPLEDFPTGIMYHHHKQFMNSLLQKRVFPYNFHMCWTQGKPDKLIYLKKVFMWYLSPSCSPLEALVEPDKEEREGEEGQGRQGQGRGESRGEIFYLVEGMKGEEKSRQWGVLAEKCCALMPGAP